MGISGVSTNNSGVASGNGSQSQVVKSLLTSLQNQPTLLDILDESSSKTTSSSGDILDLSAAGQSAADQLYQLLESAELASVQTSVAKAGAALRQKVDAALAQQGIDTTSEIDLQLDSSGNVVVANDNPQKQQIEDAINNNPELKKAVAQYVRFMQTIAPSSEGNDTSVVLPPSAVE